jgi:hypothetical protein
MEKKIVSFRITRISKENEEMIHADECTLEGSPSEFVFRRNGVEVDRFLQTSLKNVPQPVPEMSPEERKQWSDTARKMNSAVRPRNLRRE